MDLKTERQMGAKNVVQNGGFDDHYDCTNVSQRGLAINDTSLIHPWKVNSHDGNFELNNFTYASYSCDIELSTDLGYTIYQTLEVKPDTEYELWFLLYPDYFCDNPQTTLCMEHGP